MFKGNHFSPFYIKSCNLLSLLSGSQSGLNTVQVLCPIMAKEDKETLIALAINGIINWRETDREDPDKRTHTHTHIYANIHVGYSGLEVRAVCHRCVRMPGSSAVLSRGQHTGAE